MQNDSANGVLRVHVRTAGGALPVKGARVTVSTASRAPDDELLRILYTDLSGTTEDLVLPAPSASASLEADAEGPVNAEYSVSAEMRGFYGVRHSFVAVYDGVVSIQNILLIPTAEGIGTAGGVIRFDENGTPDL